jgi:hypothetical protein
VYEHKLAFKNYNNPPFPLDGVTVYMGYSLKNHCDQTWIYTYHIQAWARDENRKFQLLLDLELTDYDLKK